MPTAMYKNNAMPMDQSHTPTYVTWKGTNTTPNHIVLDKTKNCPLLFRAIVLWIYMQENIYSKLSTENMTREQLRPLVVNYLRDMSTYFNSDIDHNRAITYEIASLMSTPFILDARNEDNDIQEVILFAGELEAPSADHHEKIQQLQVMIENLDKDEKVTS